MPADPEVEVIGAILRLFHGVPDARMHARVVAYAARAARDLAQHLTPTEQSILAIEPVGAAVEKMPQAQVSRVLRSVGHLCGVWLSDVTPAPAVRRPAPPGPPPRASKPRRRKNGEWVWRGKVRAR
jgi:hypothetical protein